MFGICMQILKCPAYLVNFWAVYDLHVEAGNLQIFENEDAATLIKELCAQR
jgi:hypothetical protein